MSKPKVLMSLLTDELTDTGAFAQRLLATIFEHKELAPEFVGNFEPINLPVSRPEERYDIFVGDPFLWKRKHQIVSAGSVWHTGNCGSGAIILNAVFALDFDWLTLFRKLVETTGAHYGYLHLISDTEYSETKLEYDDSYGFFLGAHSKTIVSGFKELGWANYFGPRFVPSIDVAYLDRTAGITMEISSGVLFAISESLSDVAQDYGNFARRRTNLKIGFPPGFFRPYVD